MVGELRAADPSNVQGPVKQNASPGEQSEAPRPRWKPGQEQNPGPENQDSQHMLEQPRGYFPEFGDSQRLHPHFAAGLEALSWEGLRKLPICDTQTSAGMQPLTSGCDLNGVGARLGRSERHQHLSHYIAVRRAPDYSSNLCPPKV